MKIISVSAYILKNYGRAAVSPFFNQIIHTDALVVLRLPPLR